MDKINIPPEIQSEIDLHKDELEKYVQCMYDIVHRVNFIKEISETDFQLIISPRDYRREIICMQFRIILELILLSSLAANKKAYLEIFNKIQREWSLSDLKKALMKTNPDFFPKPLNYIMNEQTKKIGFIPSSEDFFSIKNIDTLFGLTSKHLHAHNPFAKDKDAQKLKNDLQEAFMKITKLLSLHIIRLNGLKRGIVFSVAFEKPYNVFPLWVVDEPLTN